MSNILRKATTKTMPRVIMVTGATGKQGRDVVEALLTENDFDILAVTRNPQSPSAQRLVAKSPSIRLVQGNMDDAPALFRAAKDAAKGDQIWGVFSVQVAVGNGATPESELRQGKAMVDEAIKANVKHFVYSSVDRGGDTKSWENPTNVPHFRSKHEIELHLLDTTADGKSPMKWTILRPAIFMDNLAPGFESKVLLTTLRDTLKNKPLQWVATKDIGIAAALAFRNSDAWHKRATSLASDELTFTQMNDAFKKITGKPAPTTFGFLGTALKYGVPEVGKMVNWFRDAGYGANIAENRKFNPGCLAFEAWLKSSPFNNR